MGTSPSTRRNLSIISSHRKSERDEVPAFVQAVSLTSPLARRSIIVKDNTSMFYDQHPQTMCNKTFKGCGSSLKFYEQMGKTDLFSSSFMNFMYRDNGLNAATRIKIIEKQRKEKMKKFEMFKA